MIRSIGALALAAIVALPPAAPAFAQRDRHYDHDWHGGPDHGRDHDHGGGGAAVGGALLGLGVGALIGGAIASSQPAYRAPPPAYYGPPPQPYSAPPPPVYYGY